MSVAPAMAPPSSLPPPLSSGAPPGAPPPTAQPFHSALAEEWARTAPAEGQQNESRQAEAPARAKQDEGSHRHAGKTGEAQQAAAEALGVEGAVVTNETPRESVSAAGAAAVAGARSSSTAAASGGDPRVAGKASAELEGTLARGSSSGSAPAAVNGEEPAAAPQHEASLDSASARIASSLPAAAEEAAAGETSAGTAKTTGQDAARKGAHVDLPSVTSKSPQTSARPPVAAAPSASSSGPNASTESGSRGEAQANDPASTATQADPAGLSTPSRSSVQQASATARTTTAATGSEAPAAAPARSSQETAARAILGGSTRGRLSTQATAVAAARQAGGSSPATQPLELAVGHSAPTEAASSVEGAPLLSSGVDLEEMIDSIHATIELAARQGMSQARIALQPAELGQIRIHLSQTSEGLLARVTADTPAAAQALNASRSELHQSLSSLGSTLLRLDIGSFNQPEGRDATGTAAAGSSGRGRTTDGEGNIDQIDEPNGSGPTQRLPLGGLVDVLA
jgi:flagellar hook-length control protein FliK